MTDSIGRRESHPFLDPRFIEATYGLDMWWPVRDGHTRALQAAAFSDRLPPLVAQRHSKADFDFGWLDSTGFDMLLGKAKEGKANAAIPLSRCVSLDRWRHR